MLNKLFFKASIICTFIMFACGGINAFSHYADFKSGINLDKTYQQENDTNSQDSIPIGYDLKEIIVEGDNYFKIDDGISYIPDKRAKKASYSGVSLLTMMAIPSLIVDPSNNNVTTSSGENVSFFIDFIPASSNDINGIRPQDVKTIEILEYPRNPKFNGAKHVINYIMVKYEYGGYTKLDGAQTVIANTGEYSLRSKMQYKKMTYDFGAGIKYYNDAHYGTNQTINYKFPDYLLTKNDSTIDGEKNTNSYYFTGRAIYSWGNNHVSNVIGYATSRVPSELNKSTESVFPSIYPDTNSETKSDTDNKSVSWQGDYFFDLNNGFSLMLNPSLSYADNYFNYRYLSEGDNLINMAKEKIIAIMFAPTLYKQFGRHSLGLQGLFSYQGNRIDYSGSHISKMESDQYGYGGNIIGNFYFSNLQLEGNIGVFGNNITYGELKNNQPSISMFIYGRYPLPKNIQLSATTEMAYLSTGMSYRSPHLTISNLIDATQGNPNLKYTRYNSFSLRCQQNVSLIFSFNAFIKWEGEAKPINLLYTPATIDNRMIMVKSFVNGGYLSHLQYGANFSLNIFSRALRITTGITGNNTRRHGKNYQKCDYLKINATATYLYKNVYATFGWRNKSKSLTGELYSEAPEYYNLTVGYGNGNFNARITASNFISSSWESNVVRTIAENYNNISTMYNSWYHRQFTVSLTYSFGYGKKIQRGNEIGQTNSSESAILK